MANLKATMARIFLILYLQQMWHLPCLRAFILTGKKKKDPAEGHMHA